MNPDSNNLHFIFPIGKTHFSLVISFLYKLHIATVPIHEKQICVNTDKIRSRHVDITLITLRKITHHPDIIGYTITL